MMKGYVLVFIFLISLVKSALAQSGFDLIWSSKLTGLNEIVYGKDHGAYVYGKFQEGLEIGDYTVSDPFCQSEPCSGGRNFIVKISSEGSFEWSIVLQNETNEGFTKSSISQLDIMDDGSVWVVYGTNSSLIIPDLIHVSNQGEIIDRVDYRGQDLSSSFGAHSYSFSKDSVVVFTTLQNTRGSVQVFDSVFTSEERLIPVRYVYDTNLKAITSVSADSDVQTPVWTEVTDSTYINRYTTQDLSLTINNTVVQLGDAGYHTVYTLNHVDNGIEKIITTEDLYGVERLYGFDLLSFPKAVFGQGHIYESGMLSDTELKINKYNLNGELVKEKTIEVSPSFVFQEMALTPNGKVCLSAYFDEQTQLGEEVLESLGSIFYFQPTSSFLSNEALGGIQEVDQSGNRDAVLIVLDENFDQVLVHQFQGASFLEEISSLGSTSEDVVTMVLTTSSAQIPFVNDVINNDNFPRSDTYFPPHSNSPVYSVESNEAHFLISLDLSQQGTLEAPDYQNIELLEFNRNSSLDQILLFGVYGGEIDYYLYPNPSQGKLSFIVDSRDVLSIESEFQVFDTKGKLVYSEPLRDNGGVHDFELPPGTYICYFSVGGETHQEMVVVY